MEFSRNPLISPNGPLLGSLYAPYTPPIYPSPPPPPQPVIPSPIFMWKLSRSEHVFKKAKIPFNVFLYRVFPENGSLSYYAIHICIPNS